MDFDPDQLARLNDNPLYRTIGIRIEALGAGEARSVMQPQAQVCWPSQGPHGGILFTLMDTTMAFAAMTHAGEGGACATVDCSIQYAAPARAAPFHCHARTAHRAGRTVFMRAEITDAQGAPVAFAQGSFRLFDARR